MPNYASSHPTSWPSRLGLVVLGILLGLLLGEVLAHALGFAFRPHMRNRVYFAEPDPWLGWRNRAGMAGPYGGDEFLTWVTINPAGQRGPEHPVARRPGTRRILVLGDSQAWGDGVADAETFSALLDGGHVEVVNLAVIGYGTDQQLLALDRAGAAYHPDVVLVAVYVGNDFTDNTETGTWQYPKPRFVIGERGSLVLDGSPTSVPAWLQAGIDAYRAAMRFSALLNALAHAATPVDPIRPPGYRGWVTRGKPVRALYASPVAASERVAFELTTRLLIEIARHARAIGATPVVLLLPEVWQVEAANDPSWRAELRASRVDWRRPQKVLRRALEADGVLVIDALQPLARESPEPTVAAPTYYPGWKHLTTLGHRTIAELLRRRVLS